MANSGNSFIPGADDWSNSNLYSIEYTRADRDEIRELSEDFIEAGGQISQYDMDGEFIGYSVQI